MCHAVKLAPSFLPMHVRLAFAYGEIDRLDEAARVVDDPGTDTEVYGEIPGSKHALSNGCTAGPVLHCLTQGRSAGVTRRSGRHRAIVGVANGCPMSQVG